MMQPMLPHLAGVNQMRDQGLEYRAAPRRAGMMMQNKAPAAVEVQAYMEDPALGKVCSSVQCIKLHLA